VAVDADSSAGELGRRRARQNLLLHKCFPYSRTVLQGRVINHYIDAATQTTGGLRGFEEAR
jgi:hypothetical protein